MGKSYELRKGLLLLFGSNFDSISHAFGSKPVHICTPGQLSSKLEHKQEKIKIVNYSYMTNEY
jgi:hypothetical protein